MSLNPGGNNYNWNYSKPDKPGYSTQLVGTVLAIQEIQKMAYTMSGQPGAPQFWPDGNPMMNIRLALATQDGELKTFVFQPAGKQARMGQKKSVHMDLFALTGNTDMMNLIGKTICIQTQEGHYGQGNPRPWAVSLVDAGPYQLNGPLPSEFKAPQVLANSAASGGQMNAPQPMQQQSYGYQPQPMRQQPMQQPMQQQYQPMQQQGYGMQPQPQYQQQPVMQPQQQYAPQPQYAQPAQAQPQQEYPGMDPNIAQAMASQVFGNGVQVEMVHQEQQGDPVGSGQAYGNDVYDDQMPF